MDSSTIVNTSNQSDPSSTGSSEKVTELKAPNIATDPTTASTTPEENANDDPDYLRPWELVPVFAAMALAIFILGLVSHFSYSPSKIHLLMLKLQDNTIVGTATPTITNEFHSLTDFGWYGSACK